MSGGQYLRALMLVNCLSYVGCLLVDDLVWEGERCFSAFYVQYKLFQ